MYEAHRRFRMKVLKAHDRNQTSKRLRCAAKHWKAQQTTAYEECLRVLRLINRADPITELLAKQIIEVAQTGVRDPSNICALTLERLGIR